MSSRPTIEQLRWEMYMPVGEGFILVFVLLLFFATIALIAFAERKKSKKKNRILKLSIGFGVVLGFGLQILYVENRVETLVKTTEEDFLQSQLNQEWLSNNFDEMATKMKPETYKLTQVIEIRKLDKETGKKKQRIYEEKDLGMLLKWEQLEDKEQIVWEHLQKENDADVFFVRMTVQNKNGELKEVEAFTTIATEQVDVDQAELIPTSSYKDDIGENILMGKLNFKENIFVVDKKK